MVFKGEASVNPPPSNELDLASERKSCNGEGINTGSEYEAVMMSAIKPSL